MKVLVACEESQAVCKAFRARGHEAYSCDLMEPSGGHPEWHILGDCLQAIMGGQIATMDGLSHEIARWDMIIAFVPCTKTSNAGARHLYKGGRLNLNRYYEGLCGKALFLAVWAADCEKVVIENPTPSKIFDYPTPTQAIQPWQFGHPFTKKTLLWERGVPPYTQQMLSSRLQHGVRAAVTVTNMGLNTRECLPQTAQKCEPKRSPVWQKPCPSNGVKGDSLWILK